MWAESTERVYSYLKLSMSMFMFENRAPVFPSAVLIKVE